MVTSFFSTIATKIKIAIEEEQEQFEKEQQQSQAKAQPVEVAAPPSPPPWEISGLAPDKQAALRERVLTLSKTKRTFLDSPPPDAKFSFDSKSEVSAVLGALQADPNLEKMRFWLVPQYIREAPFWRNYFYRISLLREAYAVEQRTAPAAGAAIPLVLEARPAAPAALAAAALAAEETAVRDPSADMLSTLQEVEPEFVSATDGAGTREVSLEDDDLEQEINAQLSAEK